MWRSYPVYPVRTSTRYGRSKFRHSDEVSHHRPLAICPASVNIHPSWVLLVATQEILDTPYTEPALLPVDAILKSRPAGFHWAITEMSLEDNGLAIASDIIQGTAIAVSDGSFKDHQGTLAFIIEGSSDQGRCVGVNIVPGEQESQSPYRSELVGIASALEAIHGICLVHSVTSGKVEMGLYGRQAMLEAFGDWPLDPSRPDFDLLQHIRGVIAASPLEFVGRWIESHQDDKRTFVKIDHWGRLNIECDGLAKGVWNSTTLSHSWLPNRQFGYEKWLLWIDKKKLSKLDKSKLYEYVFAGRTTQYWHRKHSLTPALTTSINWEACAEAMRRLPFEKKTLVDQTRHGILRGGQT
jgi:hypothetical protein